MQFVLQAMGDPHAISAQDVEALRELGTTDGELVEALETLNAGNSFNLFCDALDIGPDEFLTYAMDAPERSQR